MPAKQFKKEVKLKQQSKKKKISMGGVAALVILALGTYLLILQMKKPTAESVYEEVKTLLKTKGTEISTVKIWSQDKRLASGTSFKNGEVEIIITAAHLFSASRPDMDYWYSMDDKGQTINAVFPHPKSGTMGGKDIALCIPGKSKKIKGFWGLKKDEVHASPHVETCTPLSVTLLEGNQKCTIQGTMSNDDNDPLYIIPHITLDGDSGNGLMIPGRFFVIKGNIASSSFDFQKIFGVSQGELTIVTEF